MYTFSADGRNTPRAVIRHDKKGITIPEEEMISLEREVREDAGHLLSIAARMGCDF
ncbi:hypothetical protein KAK07_23570 [Ideonella sp. 4Y16]|uniref:Uncharacterized protein n=1 Tax=Ideonella aquatica TaxID=2824119 RepID=A0A940YHQ9_9BURK|nr:MULTISPECIES: hypothetical protein [Ideonella]MBQ0946339.1 hypothetical protein [Ideonella alba]MBQ0960453.1 hypothetical protein [Ideonella aquatica]